jgi:hypothetical protein
LQAAKQAARLQDAPSADFSEHFSRAIRVAAARGDAQQAVRLFDEMRDDFKLVPDAATYHAIVEVCEGRQPLERVWTILYDMQEQGLDPNCLSQSSQDGSDGMPPLRHQTTDICEGLRRHAEVWLTQSPELVLPEKAFQAAVSLASVLRRSGNLPSSAESVVRERIITPVIKALRGPAVAGSPEAQVLVEVQNLGDFTEEVLDSLELGTGAVQWQGAAAAELRRQALLRRWAAWEEDTGPGLLTWIAYDLSGGNGQAAWDLKSTGEVFGLSSENALDEVSVALLPPLVRDKSAGHAERRALLALTERIFGKFPEGSCQGERVEGVVMLYSTRPPCSSSIYAIKQFLRFFPWVRFCTACGGPEPQASIERIGEVPDKAKHGSEQSWSNWSSWQSRFPSNGQGGWSSNWSNAAITSNGASAGHGANGHGSWNQWV